MTKYKELHRAVQHLTDYQMNGSVVVRRAAEYRAANPDRKKKPRSAHQQWADLRWPDAR